jgi:His-Xaa-Ser system protein HxsD
MFEYDISFDAESHSADAIQRAAYRLSDRLAVELSSADGVHRCHVWVDAGDEATAQRINFDFRNEVIDQVLRERIREETAETRNVVLSLAFSQTALTVSEQ